MFERREWRAFPGTRRNDLYRLCWDWWARSGFNIVAVGPYHLHGTSLYSRIGLRREVDLRLDEVSGVTHVELSFGAALSEEGVVGGAVATVLFWPVAVVGGALSYSEFENDARAMMNAFWYHLYEAAKQPGQRYAPPSSVSEQGQHRADDVCEGCGASLAPGWKVCPYCGRGVRT